MADSDNKGNQPNSSSQNAGTEGEQKPEFLLEKFGNVEDQARAYAELEKKYHSDIASIKAEIKQLKGGVPVADTRSRDSTQDPETQELVEFYRSPAAYRARIVDEAEQRIEQRLVAREAVKTTLGQFFQANPDLAGQEPILEYYVRQEPMEADPVTRLNAAAKRTREHITNLRKAPDARPRTADFVDEPSAAQPRSRSQSKTPTEAELRKEYFQERTNSRKVKSTLPHGE